MKLSSQDSLARKITHALGGDWRGSGGLVPGLGHSTRDRSVSIKDHPSIPDDVLVHCFGRGDAITFKHALRDCGLLPRRGYARASQQHQPSRPHPVGLSDEQRRWRQLAQAIWTRAAPVSDHNVAGIYLREARSIPGPWPTSLRSHLRCPRGQGEAALPALVAALTVPTTGEFCAVHRIFLRADGSGKADLPRERQKMSLGPSRGAAVVLGNLHGSADAILEGEGIETTLTAVTAMNLSGIAALGLSCLGRAPLPAGRPVIILADRGGEDGARRAAEKRRAEGRVVRIALPPHGCKDFNDMVRGK